MKLLIPEPPLQVLPSLAQRIGLTEAIIAQLLFEHASQMYDGWVIWPGPEWEKALPWCSRATVTRALRSLRASGLVETRRAGDQDARRAYRVDGAKIRELVGA